MDRIENKFILVIMVIALAIPFSVLTSLSEEKEPLTLLIDPVDEVAAREAAEAEAAEDEEEEEEDLIEAPDNPGFYLNKHGQVVDDLGLVVKLSESKNSCINCHYNSEKYETLVLKWNGSKHAKNKVTCSRCHGGDPTKKSIGEAKSGKTTDFFHIKSPLKDLRLTWDGPGTPLGGAVVENAFRFCGQCHGTIFRDWEAGIHGKRTGYWNGKKEYKICFRCHNPHNPKFQPLHPKPPPVSPYEIKFDSVNKTAKMTQKRGVKQHGESKDKDHKAQSEH